MIHFMTGKVGVIVALADVRNHYAVIRIGQGDDFGLYVSTVVNSFGTPLAARGNRADIDAFVAQHRTLTQRPR